MRIIVRGDGPYNLDAFWDEGIFERSADTVHLVCGDDGKPAVFASEAEAVEFIERRLHPSEREGYRFSLIPAD